MLVAEARLAFPELLFFSPHSQTKHEILQNSADRRHQSQAAILTMFSGKEVGIVKPEFQSKDFSIHVISIQFQHPCLTKRP